MKCPRLCQVFHLVRGTALLTYLAAFELLYVQFLWGLADLYVLPSLSLNYIRKLMEEK